MNTTDVKPSSTLLAEVNPQAIARYKGMRALVMPAPDVDVATCETVLAMQLAVRGHEVPFKIHAMRALAQSMSLGQMEGLLLSGIGVSLLASEAARALAWLREAHEELTRSSSSAG